MQIDGHHTATYVAARLAGFNFEEAQKIAYAAQYVDDATNPGIIQFSSSPYFYSRIASAHKMIDYSNLIEVDNHLAWLPFHFLPGNAGLAPGADVSSVPVLQRLVCTPDSVVARDMLRFAFRDRGSPRALHRLGITMHVYADTFAHQGFVGAMCEANRTQGLTTGDLALDKEIASRSVWEMVTAMLRNVRGSVQFLWRLLLTSIRERTLPTEQFSRLLHKSPVGHAAADVYPDQPYLSWRYVDWRGNKIERDNPSTYDAAFDMMVRAMQAWRAGDSTMDLATQCGAGDADRRAAAKLFRELTDLDGEKRRQGWLTAIGSGAFSFGVQVPNYQGKGAGSWKATALGNTKQKDSGFEIYAYSDAFLRSDWKLFHDAIQAHRSDIVHEILPTYSICAA